MMRRCDGTDPNLWDENREPCACGLVFDDVERLTVYPHEPVGGRFALQLETMARYGLTIAQVEGMDALDAELLGLVARDRLE